MKMIQMKKEITTIISMTGAIMKGKKVAEREREKEGRRKARS